MNSQIYLLRPDGSELRRVTEGGKTNNFLGDFSRDGKRLWLSSNQRDPAATHPYLVVPASGAMTPALAAMGMNAITDLSRDGAYAVVNRNVSRGSNDLYLVRLAERRETLSRRTRVRGRSSGGYSRPTGAPSTSGPTRTATSSRSRACASARAASPARSR